MNSLFLIALPRSGSNLAYNAACRMLGLRQPSWTGDGEILNLDRFAGHPIPRGGFAAHFTTREQNPDLFARLTDFLDTAVRRDGFAYKDVVHPFVVSAWTELRHLRVLHVRRDPAEVACAMLRRRWYYPADAAVSAAHHTGSDSRRQCERERDVLTISAAVVHGLVQAEQALERVPAVRVDFNDVLPGRSGLSAALQELYPELELRPLPPSTKAEITVALARREQIRRSEAYRALRELVEKTRESLV
ncbi:MAG TPA: hypothetical protein VG223_11790 [Solirubrobacteraceae bacterium]|nr:hypothetical protein [Solirubrobacteraceae bacterium]